MLYTLPTDKPTAPQGPVDIMESAVTSVEFKWKPPKDSGGCPVSGYIIERQQVGRNKWANLGEIPGSNSSYRDSDVDPGRRYCYQIKAKTAEGISDYLQTEDIPAGVLRKSPILGRICIGRSMCCFMKSLASQKSHPLRRQRKKSNSAFNCKVHLTP